MQIQKIKDFSTPYRMAAMVGLMILMALSAAVFSTARAQNHGTVDIIITAGVNDNFVLPTEPTSASSDLLGSRSWSLKDFDDSTIDRVVAHTFINLPENIFEATLEIHLRAGTSFLSHNDGINLTFVEDDQIMPPVGSERWSRSIGTGHGVPGVLSYDWHSTAASPAVDTIVLDLSNLPLAPGQPASASNLIPALNQHGFLDFWIQDDTDVDYMILTVTVPRGAKVTICHIPPGNPSNAQTITVGAAAVNAHLNHGDTLGECKNDGKGNHGNGGERSRGKK